MEENQMTLEEFQSLVEALEETPRIIQQLTGDLEDGERRWKPSPEEWSVLEHICHLRDIEQEGYAARIEKLLRETQPFLADIDGDKLAAERSYNSQDFIAALHAFLSARAENAEAIKDLTLDQLNRSGMFENTGTVTLGGLLLMMREHDRGHLHDISRLHERLRKRAVGFSVAT
jgi:DinB superfamily